MTASQKYRVLDLSMGFVAVVDADVYRKVNKISWHVHFSGGRGRVKGKPYARGTLKGNKVYLHRYVAEIKLGKDITGLHVDHANHCTLDTRWENLEVVSVSENMRRRRSWAKK